MWDVEVALSHLDKYLDSKDDHIRVHENKETCVYVCCIFLYILISMCLSDGWRMSICSHFYKCLCLGWGAACYRHCV